MERAILRVQRREATGSRAARRVRRSASIPGVLYGHHDEPQPIQIDLQEFETLRRQGLSENTLINLLLDEEKKSNRLTLIREVQWDPVRNELRHLDFVHIDLKEKIKVDVPLHLIGQAEGVKKGGILEQRIHYIEIECLPTEIPSNFQVDISELDIGDSIHLTEVDLGEFETHMKLERTVAGVAAPRVLEVEEVEEVVEEPALIGEEEAEPEAVEEPKAEETGGEG